MAAQWSIGTLCRQVCDILTAECLSVRLIIVQVRLALVGSWSEVVLVRMYMSVRNGLMIEIYRFMHSLRTFLACATHVAIAMEDLEDRRRNGTDGNALHHTTQLSIW